MIDLHTHSAISDGTDTPAGLVRAAAAANLDVVALTDHDTFAGLPEARVEGRACGVHVVGGLELSTQHEGASVHLLGYGCDPGNKELAAELARILKSRAARIPQMVGLLTNLGMPVTLKDVEAQASGVSLGRPHVADALVARGFVTSRAEAFDRFLYDGGPAYVERYAPELERGVDLIRRSGGVAVIAHPWGRGGREHLSLAYLESLFYAHGLDGLEVDHNDHDADTADELRAFTAALGMLVTGGSDYHGTGKTGHPLGCHTTAPEMFQEIESRIGARGGRP